MLHGPINQFLLLSSLAINGGQPIGDRLDPLRNDYYLMSKYKYEKEFMFSSRKLEEIQLFLDNEENPLDLLAIRDAAKNTVIHHCAHHNHLPVLHHYIKYYRKNMENSQLGVADIKARTKLLLDEPNAEGYTAAHFAAYRGNVGILSLLDKYEATLERESTLKMTLLHMAAQGDKPSTMLYLHNRPFDLNAQDAKLCTPLHWAAYAASEKVTEYLLAQPDIQIDLRDQSGQTPLHVSTTYGNLKIVKKLLVAGADRSLKDHKGQTALEIAEENEFHSIRKMLDDRYSLLDYLKILCGTKVRYAPRRRNCLQPLLFLIIALILSSITFLLLQPLATTTLILQSCIFLITLLLFLSLILSPSRPVSLRPYNDFSHDQKLSQLCMWCVRPILPRQHHCPVCRICVRQYDHHCFWINNCVGRHNLGRFVLFLLTTELLLLWLGYVAVKLILMAVNGQRECWFYQLTELFQVQVWHVWTAGIFTSTIVVLFVFPLFCFILVQFKNLLLGRTTYQRFSKSTQSILTRSGSALLNPAQSTPEPSLQNCLQMCCVPPNNQKPPSQSNSTHTSLMPAG